MNNITYFQTIMIFLGTVLSGTIAGAVAAIATRKKTKAEAHKADAEAHKADAEGDKADIEATEIITRTVTDFMTKAMALDEQREKTLIEEIRKLQEQVEHLQITVNSLTEQMRFHGIEPVYPPPPRIMGN